jgi:hypothetical protein
MYMLRRFYVLAFFVLGALVAVGLASPFLTQGESAPAPARGRDAAPAGGSFRSQQEADRSLVRFDREHPQCQLWTNWQKMCSRTGPNGATNCVTDPDRPVRPSAPFCVYAGEGTMTPDLEGPDVGSVGRYCIRSRTHGVYSGPGSDPGRQIRYCAEFDPRRPFNGRSLAARRHGWCAEWSDTSTERPVCVEGAARGRLPSCAGLARAHYRHNRPLYCSRLAAPPWCGAAEGLLDRTESSPEGVSVNDVRYRSSDFLPVHGVVCRRTADNDRY